MFIITQKLTLYHYDVNESELNNCLKSAFKYEHV